MTAKPATVVADAKGKIYGEANPGLTAAVTGTVNGDTLLYTLGCAAVATTGVGTSPITVSLGVNPNYTVTPTDALLTITAKPATVVADAKSKVYGEANPGLTATVGGTVNGDTLLYTLGCAADATTGWGDFPDHGEPGGQPELHRDADRRAADDHGQAGDGGGGRQEQGLWRSQSGADGDGGRHGQRRHAALHAGAAWRTRRPEWGLPRSR